MRILFVASEATPFIKSGGLADVIGSLPFALQEEHECMVVLPKYKDLAKTEELEYVTNFTVWVGWRKLYCGIFKATIENVTFYFIDNEQFFNRDGLYGYGDDYERFAFFDMAVIEMIGHLQLQLDILHLHDWQAAMIAMLYKEKYYQYPHYENIKIIFTIHNIAYQGKADPKIISDMFGLDDTLYTEGKCRHDGCLNMMKAAIVYSDEITTVSPTYASEILTPTFGERLESILQMRKNNLHGIINGIDDTIINPETNEDIVQTYNIEEVHQKKGINKLALQKEVGLPINKAIPCIGIVSRLTWQKGIDLILCQIEELIKENVQLIILGAGDLHYEQALIEVQKCYPTQVSYQQKYDAGLANRIYASCDMFLMPSLFEPCGLSQMMALRFGTIPIVRETGGLKDSVDAYNKYENTGNGFRFYNYNAHEMMSTVRFALSIFRKEPKTWKLLIENAMKADLDWKQSAKKYNDLYTMR
ncbi:MAG: glycogen synthase GlgA [Coprobacillaceae bacterium]